MPAFDPNLVLDSDPSVRATNSYQASLEYAAARLTAGEYTNLEAELTSVGLPTDSALILALSNPWEYVAGLRDIVMRFVADRPINPTSIAQLPANIGADLEVEGDVTLAGALEAAGVQTTGNIVAQGTITANVAILTNGDIIASGNGQVVGGVRVGALAGVASGVLSAQNRVEAKSLVLTESSDPETSPNGTFGEDASGDLFFRNTTGAITYLNRAAHDTGWLELSPLHASIGVAGAGSATPSATPDIYTSTPLTFGGQVGDAGGPMQMVLWLRADTSLVDGGAATGDFYYFIITPFESGGNPAGGQLTVDSVNRQLAIEITPNTLVPGQAGIIASAGAGLVAVRGMVWVR